MKRNSLLWGLVDIALLIILLHLLQGCTRVVYIEKPAPTQYVIVPDTLWPTCYQGYSCTLAMTVCSEQNVPVVFIRKGYVLPVEMPFTTAHEEVHVAQLRKDCRAGLKSYISSYDVRLKMESEAYCAEGRERLRIWKDLAVVSNWYTSMIQALFEGENVACNLKPP